MEIDSRAAQIAGLALAMCAREMDRRFFNRGVQADMCIRDSIMSYLDAPLKDKTPRQQELERRLREEIFIDWSGM